MEERKINRRWKNRGQHRWEGKATLAGDGKETEGRRCSLVV